MSATTPTALDTLAANTAAKRPSRRAAVADALDRIGILDRCLWLRARFRLPILTVMTYHRVAERADYEELDHEVVETTPTEFAAQLEVIQSHCTVVSTAEIRQFQSGRALPPNPVLLAFDDGYRDNHEIVMPVLEHAGVSGTFFIPTAFPDGGKLFWWDKVALLVRRCRRPSIALTYPKPLVLAPIDAPADAIKAICRGIKSTPRLSLDRLFEDLERATGVSVSPAEERAIAERTIMGFDQVRALRACGMDVQSHSHSHRVLDTLSPQEAEIDLLRSRRILSDVLGENVRTIAYPVGYALEGAYRRAVHAAGFDLGFTNASGLCLTSSSSLDPLNMPRLSMDRGQVGALYKLTLLLGERPNVRVIG